jgi:hypothetical protein
MVLLLITVVKEENITHLSDTAETGVYQKTLRQLHIHETTKYNMYTAVVH